MENETKVDKFMICPFHGMIEAIEKDGNYKCTVKDCDVTREEKELE